MAAKTKLSPSQRSLVAGDVIEQDGRTLVWLSTGAQDRTARSLHRLGLGVFTDNGGQYSWRKRSGYGNILELTATGLALRAELRAGR